jgi:hypothetical protein
MNELPPLPKSEATPWHPFKYTDQQMHAYAAAAVAAERERCAKLCDDVARSAYELDGRHSSGHTEGRGDGAAECAALIRAKAAT